jgi:hypothetical protein
MKIIRIFIGVFCMLFFCFTICAQQNFNRSYYLGNVTFGMGVIPYHNHFIVGGYNSNPVLDSNLSSGTYYNKVMGFTFRTDLVGDSIYFQNYYNEDSVFLNQFSSSPAYTFIHGTKGENGNSYWTGYGQTSPSVYFYQTFLYIVKLDSLGNTIWEKSYDAPGDSSYVGWTIDYNQQTGRIVTCGYLTKNTQDKQGFIVEIDTAGNLLKNWVPINVNIHENNFISVISIDSIIIAVGDKRGSGFNNRQPLICAVNTNGQLLWSHYFPPASNNNFVANVVAISSQEFILYWVHAVKQGTSPWVWVHHLVKMDITGNIIWDKPVFYSYHTSGRLKYLDNGNVMYSGVFKDTLGGPMNGYLVIFDSAGSILWDRLFLDTWGAFQWFRDGAPTMDGGFIMTGDASGNVVNPITLDISQDLWIVKTDSNGLITSNNQLEPPPLAQSHLSPSYPNPANDYSIVDVIIPPNIEKALLHVFDITGREISTFTLQEGLSQLKIDTSHLKNGTYLLAMSLNGYKDDVQKLVVRR